MGFVVMQARPLDLTEGLNPNWWEIIHNLETGNGYKGCETSYFPGCKATAQITAIREPVPVFLYALFARLSGDSPSVLQFQQVLYAGKQFIYIKRLGNKVRNTNSSS